MMMIVKSGDASDACYPDARGPSEPARDRLLQTALRLFAEHGYAKTSIRQIAAAADVNVASISYYFGNKAGLYRAVFFGPPAPGLLATDAVTSHPTARRGAMLSLAELYRRILEPLKTGELGRHWIRLQRREMLEPTGLWKEKLDRGMQPAHEALVAMLCGELGVSRPDNEVRALAVMIIALPVHLLMACEVVDVLAPDLLSDAGAIDRWQVRLLRSAEAMIDAERLRRQALSRGRDASPDTSRPRRPTRARRHPRSKE